MLTATELRVLHGVALGFTNDEIAERIYLSEFTVKTHLQRITKRTGVRGRAGLVALAFKHGWLTWVDDELVITPARPAMPAHPQAS